MSYIIKTVKHDDNADIQKIKDILCSVLGKKNEIDPDMLIKLLEEKGYIIGKKIKI